MERFYSKGGLFSSHFSWGGAETSAVYQDIAAWIYIHILDTIVTDAKEVRFFYTAIGWQKLWEWIKFSFLWYADTEM